MKVYLMHKHGLPEYKSTISFSFSFQKHRFEKNTHFVSVSPILTVLNAIFRRLLWVSWISQRSKTCLLGWSLKRRCQKYCLLKNHIFVQKLTFLSITAQKSPLSHCGNSTSYLALNRHNKLSNDAWCGCV